MVAVELPLVLVTTTSTGVVDAVPAGSVTVSVVSEVTLSDVPATPPKVTPVADRKPVPVTVMSIYLTPTVLL